MNVIPDMRRAQLIRYLRLHSNLLEVIVVARCKDKLSDRLVEISR
jgi:hypothetical protein